MKKLLRKCPICNNSKHKLMFEQKFALIDGVSFLDGYDVVSCKQCGFVYASNIPEQSEFDTYYINANKYEHETEQPDVITGKYEHILQEIIHFNADKTVSIVDIGCARSEILRLLRDRGYSNLTGIDPSINNVEYLKSKGINGIHATIRTLDTSKQYEVVVFLAVLEHIRDIHQTLSTIGAITAPNGMIIVLVPDMTAQASGELPYQEFSREHINYFTEISLSNLMTQYEFLPIFQKKERGELIGFFRKKSKSIHRDNMGEKCIQRYIGKSKKYEDEIYTNLSQFLDVPLIIWGCGTFTQRLLEKMTFKNIVAFVDSAPKYAGKNYKGISIIPPDELKKYKEPVLIATSHRYIESITRTIRNELKLDNEIVKLHIDYSFAYSV